MFGHRRETLNEELLLQVRESADMAEQSGSAPRPVPPPQDEPIPRRASPSRRYRWSRVMFGLCGVCGVALILAGRSSALWGSGLGWVLAVVCVASGVAGNALIGGFDRRTGGADFPAKPQNMWRNR